ncbi:type VI secretion system-associated lipoprotein [Rouxiella silvae]|uniref:Type VI secretion system-associated lipoprotein n=2 Tax=Rouxiella silvae TaxID=1646373 RepID=A0ABX3TU82_9GAMM|nr:type VI secretion system-associated lipoprotein [Rouxiella silvae]
MRPKMANINIKPLPMISSLIISTLLSGCGLMQSVSDGTVSMTKAIFYKHVKTLHLDFITRAAANNDAGGVSHTAVVRVYQLKDRKLLDAADYQQLFAHEGQVIRTDLLAEKDLQLRPDESQSLDMPLEPETRYIVVAGMFLSPDMERNNWRIVLERSELEPDKARQIELKNQTLILLPLKEK